MRINFPSLTFSIDLELAIEQQGDRLEQRLDSLTTDLLELFERQAIPATWAVADPALSAATAAIRGSNLGHELAILGDRTWVGIGAGRTRFAREVSRRVKTAHAAGLDVRTLALRNIAECNDVDLLLKAGISIVRASSSTQFSFPQQVSNLSFCGVAIVEADWRFPKLGHWRAWGLARGWETWSVIGRMRRLCREGRVAHLAIDSARLMESGQTGLSSLEKILIFANRQRACGQLEITTLSNATLTGERKRAVYPTHSVLRPAA